jgi:hypothetical protein
MLRRRLHERGTNVRGRDADGRSSMPHVILLGRQRPGHVVLGNRVSLFYPRKMTGKRAAILEM